MYKNINKPHVFGEVFLSERLSSFINVMSSTSFACIVYLRLSQCTDKITTCGIFVQFTNVHLLHTYVVSLTDEKNVYDKDASHDDGECKIEVLPIRFSQYDKAKLL